MKVLIVAAPADVRVGGVAREPLDPSTVEWTREAQTDDEGHFECLDVPLGKVRVVVVVPGHERLDMYAESTEQPRELSLFVTPLSTGQYRTEVISERDSPLPKPSTASRPSVLECIRARPEIRCARPRTCPASRGARRARARGDPRW
ncbi:MAG: hypothetical protein HC927_05585 [Deltaproteobacteria bacterium]|nr:hypothetical protein [Deltaproteobacteria bacterium]